MRDEDSPISIHFWTAERIILLIIFIAGLLIGGVVTHQFIDSADLSKQAGDYNSLIEVNTAMDQRIDALSTCLINQGMNPSECGPGTQAAPSSA